MTAGKVGNIDVAKFHAEAAMAYYKKVGNRLRLEGTRAELAGMHLNLRQFQQVITPSEKALQFFEQIQHEPWISSLCTNLAEAYLETDQLEKATQYAQRVLHMELPRSRPYALYTLGLVHQRQERFEYAAVSFREGIQVSQDNGDRFIEAYLQRLLGRLLLKQKQNAESRQTLEIAQSLFKAMGIDREVEITQSDLAMLSSVET